MPMIDELPEATSSTPLAAALPHLSRNRWECIVHVGAGAGAALGLHRLLNPGRLWLIEGDPEHARQLRQAAARLPNAEVREVAVGSEALDIVWHRYSLPALNGPLDAGCWQGLYPRLSLEHSIDTRTVSIETELLGLLRGVDDGKLLLVLDVPGQELRLIEALPESLLQRFDMVVLRGCAAPAASSGWSAVGDALDKLGAAGFVAQGSDGDPCWPVHALALDRDGVKARETERRLDQLTRQAAADARRLAESAQDLARATEQRAAAEAQLARAQAEARAQQERLDEACRACEAQKQALTAQLDSLRADWEAARATAAAAERDWRARQAATEEQLAGQRSAVAELQARLLEAERARDALRESHGLVEQQLAEKDQLRQQAAGERDALRKERDALAHEAAALRQAKLAAEEQAQSSRTTAEGLQTDVQRISAERGHAQAQCQQLASERDKVAAELRQAVAERDGLRQEKAQLVQARDEQSRQAREARQRVASLEQELAELGARHGLLQEELVKAEAQIELIADLLLREPRT